MQQTVITVTHDQQEANAIADRVAVMNAGRIEQIDTPEALYARPRNSFVAWFLGLGSPVSREWLARQSGRTPEAQSLLLHPAGIRLASDAGDGGFALTGTSLVQRVHEGESWRLTVEVAGETLRFRVPLGGADLPEAGAALRLCVDPQWALPMD